MGEDVDQTDQKAHDNTQNQGKQHISCRSGACDRCYIRQQGRQFGTGRRQGIGNGVKHNRNVSFFLW